MTVVLDLFTLYEDHRKQSGGGGHKEEDKVKAKKREKHADKGRGRSN